VYATAKMTKQAVKKNDDSAKMAKQVAKKSDDSTYSLFPLAYADLVVLFVLGDKNFVIFLIGYISSDNMLPGSMYF
jgi:hypothetical protein